MGRLMAALAWLISAASLAGGTALPADGGANGHVVRVVSNGWHTAIVVPRSELAATGLLPEADHLAHAAFVEFGWGDRVYYPAREKTLGTTLSAALTPTPAVMHVAGLAAAPELMGGHREVVQVALADTTFRDLIRAIAAEFVRPAGGRAEPVGPGLYPDSHFYDAQGRFHLLNTCNTWTARMLQAGGVDISPTGITTAAEMMARLRAALGETVGSGTGER